MSGFINIQRDIWDHPIFNASPMTEREAWIWMIGRASWAGTRHMVGGSLVDVPRGSFMATLREMQGVFMWRSDKKVRNYIKKLEKNGMLAVRQVSEGGRNKTHLTICNYEEYQSKGRGADAARTQRGRSADALKKEGKKVIRKEEVKYMSDFDDFYEAFPRKLDPGKARKAYLSAIKKVDAETILRGCKLYADHVAKVGTETKYIKHPTSWLNAESWANTYDDEQPQLKALNGGTHNGQPASKSQRRMEAFIRGAKGAG